VPWIISLVVSVAVCHFIAGLWYVIAGPLAGLAVAAFLGGEDD